MPFTFTLDGVPIGWAELLIVELEGKTPRNHTAVGWGELHSYQPFDELRSLLMISRAARSGPSGRKKTVLHAIGLIELLGPSNTPIATQDIDLDEIRPASYFVAYVTFLSSGASVAGAIPPIPTHGLNAQKTKPTEAPPATPSEELDRRKSD
jgi:hypothetical protein